MSLTTLPGVWQPGVWASTVWADGVWYEAGTPVDTTVSTGGGGGYPNKHPLPQYYSRRVLDERISLPQDAKSNEVAISVLDDANDLEKRLAKGDNDYADMVEQTDHMLKQVAVYVESQQIYSVVRRIENKIKTRRDNEIARLSKEIQDRDDDAEFQEIIDLI